MRRLRVILLTAAVALLLTLPVFRRVPAPPTARPGTAPGVAVVRTDTAAYSTRPLRRDEVNEPLLPVALPAGATDVQFAAYAEWQAYEVFVTFRAPPTTCLAYARDVLAAFNGARPDRRVPADLTPLTRPVGDVGPRTLPVAWFTPQAITAGVEGGADGSHQPRVWVDTGAGAFYYRYTD